jgi:hypothetical protein
MHIICIIYIKYDLTVYKVAVRSVTTTQKFLDYAGYSS